MVMRSALAALLALSCAPPAAPPPEPAAAHAEELEGRWQVVWTRPANWRPRDFTGHLDLRPQGDGWSARLHFRETAAELALESFQPGEPHRAVFSLGEMTLELAFEIEGDALEGTASTAGRIAPSPFTGTRMAEPEALAEPALRPAAIARSPEPSALRAFDAWAAAPGSPQLTADGAHVWRWVQGDGGSTLRRFALDADAGQPARPLAVWWAPEPGGSALIVRSRLVARVSPEGEAAPIAELPGGEIAWVEPAWAEQLLVICARTDAGGLEVSQVHLDTGEHIPLAAHPAADDVVLSAARTPRAWFVRELEHGGRGVRRWRVEVSGRDGVPWGEVAQPLWIEQEPTVRVGDGPIRLLAGEDLVSLATLTPEGATYEPVEGAWADATRLLVSADGAVDAVGWTAERLRWSALSDDGAELEWLAGQLDGDLAVRSRAAGDRYWVLETWSGSRWPRYWRFDRETRALDALSDEADGGLAQVDPLVIEARDGRRIAAFLTRPDPAAYGEAPWPTVVDIHGGPWAGRHRWRVDAAAQAWADRGYAVLQVNFRGTYGFGWSLTHSEEADFGAEMFGDLEDAIAWAIDEGYADPDAIAAVGASYGGYAALRLATAADPLIHCAAGGLVRGNITTPGGGLNVRSVKTRAWREARSPDRFTANLAGPVLVWNGGLDGQNADAIQDFVARARADDKDVIWIRFPWEAHGLSSAANREALYALQDRFIGACLGGPAQPFPARFGQAELEVRGDVALAPGLSDLLE